MRATAAIWPSGVRHPHAGLVSLWPLAVRQELGLFTGQAVSGMSLVLSESQGGSTQKQHVFFELTFTEDFLFQPLVYPSFLVTSCSRGSMNIC